MQCFWSAHTTSYFCVTCSDWPHLYPGPLFRAIPHEGELSAIEIRPEAEHMHPFTLSLSLYIYNYITLILGIYNKIVSASKNLQPSINFAGKIIHQISVTSLCKILQLQGSGKKNDTTIYMPVLI